MEIGIIGLVQSGKSTLFEIMTGVQSSEIYGESCVRGVASVPDERFDRLVEIFKPAKVSPARVPFIDVNAAGEKPWDSIRQNLVTADAFVHVVDAFTASDVSEVVARYKNLADELVFSDLVVVEGRIERLARLQKHTIRPEEAMQAVILPRAKGHLEAGRPLRDMEMSAEDKRALSGFAFWTLRPELVVINVRDDNPSFAEAFADRHVAAAHVIGINCMLEAEIAELPPHDRLAFLEPMGIAEPAFERVIRSSFELLGRIRYFTVGEDEVKAWVIPAGSTAPRAAAAIHKDFERGFIKAEVVSYDDFIACGAALQSAKAAGRQRLEGKEYVVRDGDIISFRFNV
ncbi:MAG: redox-regulated ATPase YchF [Proteobacteria bacterium]|nr:redox-regulated ATPase YchF [Pseudomonadota bacterium]